MRLSRAVAILKEDINVSEYSFVEPKEIALLALRVVSGTAKISHGPNGSSASTFLSRVGFYDYCGITDPHGIFGDTAKTIEICEPSINSDKVFDSLSKLIIDPKCRLTIEHMLIELIANIEMHSNGRGAIVGQVIRDHLKICIADNGIGVRDSLAQNPLYSQLTEHQALIESVKKGVTNGRGRGFGLWAATEVIKKNGGSLVISSGSHEYDVGKGIFSRAPAWAGTYVHLVYNLSNPVNYTEATGLGEGYEGTKYFDFGF